jgi:hypothetical protein
MLAVYQSAQVKRGLVVEAQLSGMILDGVHLYE